MANIGGSPAKIVMHHYNVFVFVKEAAIDTVRYEFNNADLKIRAGEAAGVFLRGKTCLTREQIAALLSKTDDAWTHVVGVFAYIDDLGIKRRTAYWRRYEPAMNGRFSASDDDDLEYED